MDAKLAAFRAARISENTVAQPHRHIASFWAIFTRRIIACVGHCCTSLFALLTKHLSNLVLLESGGISDGDRAETDSSVVPVHEAEEAQDEGTCSLLDALIVLVKVSLWLVLFAISVRYQFGAAYFLVTALPIIYYSTSTRRRRAGEPSAYSVFNRNCERIEGTLTAEQLQRQMLLAPLT